VYYKDTDAFESPKKEILREQYVFMARRLWNIITVPAFVLMTIFGTILILINPTLLQM
jgi:putative membrane protein